MKSRITVFMAVLASLAALASCTSFGAIKQPLLSEDGLFKYQSPSSLSSRIGYLYKYRLSSGGGIAISAYLGSSSEVEIPKLLGKKPVAVIDEEVFKGRGLKTVTFPKSVTHIGALAFADNLLTEVTITADFVRIDAGAFKGNPINRVTLPKDAVVQHEAFSSDLALYYHKNLREPGVYTVNDGKILYNGAEIAQTVTLFTANNAWLERIGDRKYDGIDGYTIIEGNKGGYFIPPGTHSLVVNYNNLSTIDTGTVTLEPKTFVTGKSYLLTAAINGSMVYFTVTEIE